MEVSPYTTPALVDVHKLLEDLAVTSTCYGHFPTSYTILKLSFNILNTQIVLDVVLFLVLLLLLDFFFF